MMMTLLLIPALFIMQESVAPTVGDTVVAVQRATAAARAEPMGGYYLGGAVATPFALASVLAVTSGAELKPWMAAGPVGLIAIGASTRRAPLPAGLEAGIRGEDSVYKAAYRRTYEQVVTKRRRSATALGGLLGVIAAGLLMVVTFSGAYS